MKGIKNCIKKANFEFRVTVLLMVMLVKLVVVVLLVLMVEVVILVGLISQQADSMVIMLVL